MKRSLYGQAKDYVSWYFVKPQSLSLLYLVTNNKLKKRFNL